MCLPIWDNRTPRTAIGERRSYMNEVINQLDIAGVEVIKEHFSLTPLQVQQFTALGELYRDWNAKINVISRKDIDNLYPHHIVHSLAIAKVLRFQPGTTLLDVGTGGGFPGIPLAILFPECQFTLIDSIGKKIKVATEIANAIGLKNVTCIQERAIYKLSYNSCLENYTTGIKELLGLRVRIQKIHRISCTYQIKK